MGFGYRESSPIIGLISDIRDRQERAEVRRYERERQEERDDIAMADRAYNIRRQEKQDAWQNKVQGRQLMAWDEQDKQKAYRDQANNLYGQLDSADDGQRAHHAIAKQLSTGEYVDLTNIVAGNKDMMQYVNASRGNSGKGRSIHGRQMEDGSVGLFTQTDDGEMLPFTVDPKDNSTAQLHIAGEDVLPTLTFQSNVQKAIKDSGNADVARAHAQSGAGVTADENGRVRVDGLQARIEESNPNQFRNDVDKSEIFSGRYPTANKDENGDYIYKDSLFGEEASGNRHAAQSFREARAKGSHVETFEKSKRATGRDDSWKESFKSEETAKAAQAELDKQPKLIQKRIELVLKDPVQGVDQRAPIRKKIAELRVKSGDWDIQEAENFKATGDPTLSKKTLAEYDFKSKKAQVDFITANLKMQKAANDLQSADKEKVDKAFEAYRKYAPELARRGLSAMGVKDDYIKQEEDVFMTALDASMQHAGFKPDAIKHFGTAAMISKTAQVFSTMNRGNHKFTSTLPAMSAVMKGFGTDNSDEFAEAYAFAAKRLGGEDKVYDLLNASKFKGKDAIILLQEIGNRVQ